MLTITPIPAFSDNYIWCLHDQHNAIAVDPGDAAPLRDYLRAHGLSLRALLITHHHPDHIGGIAELAQEWPQLAVFGPHNPKISGITTALREGDTVDLLGVQFAVLEVPGHTLDHIAFVTTNSATDHTPPLLFCGDTLFAAGCGRLFEGSPAQMLTSLQKLATLPASTRIHCTHEYTLSNLKFAHTVEPDNADTTQRLAAVTAQRAAQQVTLPSDLATELATNPFLRSNQASVRRAALAREPEVSSDAEIFAVIRRWKDQF